MSWNFTISPYPFLKLIDYSPKPCPTQNNIRTRRTGSHADTCTFKAVLSVADANTQEYFSKLVGTHEKLRSSQSQNFDPYIGAPTGHNTSYSQDYEKRIIKPKEFITLQEIILVYPHPHNFCRAQKRPYYRYTDNDDEHKSMYIGELQGLQRQMNFLKTSGQATREPYIELAMDILRDSQDKLYSALAQHGVTAEDVHRILMENNDNSITKEIMQLQRAKYTLRKQLTRLNLTPTSPYPLKPA